MQSQTQQEVSNINLKQSGLSQAENYNFQLEVAKFTNLKEVEGKQIMVLAGQEKNSQPTTVQVYFIYGYRQPQSNKSFEHFQYYFIKTLDSVIENQQYTIVYFVGKEYFSSGFTQFRDFFKCLPPKYFNKLKGLYVINASYIVRTLLYFETSSRGKLIQSRTIYLRNLNQLFNMKGIRKNWVDFIPNYMKVGHHYESLYSLRNDSIESEIAPLKNILGRPLELYPLTQLGIPVILDQLITYFVERPDKILCQGIFRKQGPVTEESVVLEKLSFGQWNVLQTISNPNVVASMLKQFFNQLPIPIFSFDLYQTIFEYLEETFDIAFVASMIQQLNKLNRHILCVILGFILDISKQAEHNQMTIPNMAIVWMPCFLRPKTFTIENAQKMGKMIKFVDIMLINHTYLFPQKSYTKYLIITFQQNYISSFSLNSSQHEEFKEDLVQTQKAEQEIQLVILPDQQILSIPTCVEVIDQNVDFIH